MKLYEPPITQAKDASPAFPITKFSPMILVSLAKTPKFEWLNISVFFIVSVGAEVEAIESTRIPIIPFYDDKSDEEMLHLVYYLNCLANVEDVRE